MYWLNGVASQLSLANALRGNTDNPTQDADKHFRQPLDIVSVEPSPHASLFVSCTSTAVYLWSVKPTAVLSFVERSEKHINEFGANKHIMWKPDATAIVILTTKNYLLLYAILNFDQRSFEFNFPHSHHAFVTGPGEGGGPRTMLLKFRLAIRVDAGVACGTSSDDTLIIATQKPAAIQCISWNPHEVNSTQTAVQSKLGIFVNPSEKVVSATYDKAMNVSVWITDAGRVYFIQNTGSTTPRQRRRSSSSRRVRDMITWTGTCFHGEEELLDAGKQATSIAVNGKFSLIAVGTKSGKVYVYSANNYISAPTLSHEFIRQSNGPADMRSKINATESSIKSLAWTSDGYALAVGFESKGIAIWSVYGHLLSSISDIDDIFFSQRDGDEPYLSQDSYIKGVSSLFWGPGNHHLFILSAPELKDKSDDYFAIESERASLFTIPFAKSAITNFHNADNARRGLLQMDDRILLYNYGGDYQENNTTTIDPDAVLWTQVLYPPMYITDHWPIRYSSISSDGKFVAVAGRRGLAHYNTFSNRWKMFGNQQQEQGFLVRGGMAWYKNILIAACEVLNAPLRLYSRDNNLDNAHILYTETLQHTPLYINICGNYLLVYTADNVLNIYNIITRSESINAANAAIMNGNGNVNVARLERVRRVAFDQMNSLGDIISANIIILVDGKLIMLCPRVPVTNSQSQYDLHVLSDKVEYYWIGRKSIANLLTSLWIVDGKGVKVFANLLRSDDYGFNTFSNDPFESTIFIPLDFYPHSVLLEKGVVIGIEQGMVFKESLGFMIYKMSSKTHLFIHHILQHLLRQSLEEDAVVFGRAYERLIYFGHSLEILLHTVLEEETENRPHHDPILPLVIKYLDQFPHALDVIVSCARKTEVALWDHLFSVVGEPKDLFELCLSDGRLRTATSYLIILQTMQPLAVGGKDTIRLLQKAMDVEDFELCKELVRFLSSIDSKFIIKERV
ncbi:RIC1-domain-containing protein [Phascolomyces articulosus]|uniref:RIC1-domain-containing protein n=1 Tax=Phascolomyces articulosus TaxID=60185 RepID=A0AAD5PAB4_9FUNG|nr:RIC1-domain-containing protein [Phascolomyces articulosus]